MDRKDLKEQFRQRLKALSGAPWEAMRKFLPGDCAGASALEDIREVVGRLSAANRITGAEGQPLCEKRSGRSLAIGLRLAKAGSFGWPEDVTGEFRVGRPFPADAESACLSHELAGGRLIHIHGENR